ncbi:uncharacterized protein F5891DRAFT_1186380 [Suillus fuscotomentosus]|uniref:Tetraspanin Tsp2 n=1 Tax=Suillus fuscotomentosus TaxID=1912939 RepID=A0AAD4EAJ9_9AGAM|nr:uncharacterized protein F5891DRAFT_1186380 [Suillus fuscotomentosus]KAG1902738.1 hypothetical protein F5891DRAFT_1186380 [Suillus fuscotomentosus]
MQFPLEPPTPLFAADESSSAPPSPRADSTTLSKDVSLSVNYLPNKFASGLLSPTPRRRRPGKANDDHPAMHKRGGGREAFKSGEARMPAEGDEDYDGVTGGWFGGKEGGHTRPHMHWNRFKWALFIANLALSIYGLAGLIFCLLTWFDVFEHADIIRVGNRTELVFSTAAAVLASLTSIIGWAGILLNNRSFLAVYTFTLWLCFALLVTPGYMTYKQRTFNLEGKLNSHSIAVDITPPSSKLLSPKAVTPAPVLPGCKEAYVNFEKHALDFWYTIAFSLVPLQLVIMLAGLLCSNHITYRFGKGMMPKAYRLSMASMAVIMDNYANQLAEQYGTEIASDILARSRHLDSVTYASGVANGTGTTYALSQGRYDSLAVKSPYTERI